MASTLSLRRMLRGRLPVRSKERVVASVKSAKVGVIFVKQVVHAF